MILSMQNIMQNYIGFLNWLESNLVWIEVYILFPIGILILFVIMLFNLYQRITKRKGE